MRSDRDWKSLVAISALAGSSVGLMEATWVMERKAGVADGVLMLLNGALGYAACSLLLAVIWYALASRRARPEPDRGWATAASIPVGIIAALVPITRTEVTGGAGEVLMRLVAAGALGLQVILLLRMCVRRLPFLGKVSSWLACHGAVMSLGIVALLVRESNGKGLWVGLVLAIGAIGTVWYVQQQQGARGRIQALIVSNVIAAAVLLLLPVLAHGNPGAGETARGRPNVLLITVDTVRADHVGAYGYKEARTPHMDRMATEGVQFLETVAPVPLTCPSHSSILTGLYPIQHGALHNGTPLPSHTDTLPGILARNGYRTGAIVSGYTLKDDACGLAAHFETYDDNFSAWWWLPDNATRIRLWEIFARAGKKIGLDLWRADRPAGRTTDLALRWLERARQGSFFLWLHYFDPHEPYEPPAPYDRLHDPDYEAPHLGRWYYGVSIQEKEKVVNDPRAVRHMIALYDGEISYVDAQLGRLREALKTWGLDRNTLVILTSDHGESLGEHNYYFEHSNYLYEEELRVPLILTFPQGQPAGRRISGSTELIDIAPTVLDYVGLNSEVPLEGRSLKPLIAGKPGAATRPAFAAVHPGVWESGRSIYALRYKGYKLIWTSPEWRFFGIRIPPQEELYDLNADPLERRSLAAEAPPALPELRQSLNLWREKEVDAPAAMSDEVKQRLRSLGYVK